MNHNSIPQKENAVSPVIGTILIVALTVILIAIIAAVIMPMADANDIGTVGLIVTPDKTTGLDVVFTGGEASQISDMKIFIDGEEIAGNYESGNAPGVGATYTFDKGNYPSGMRDVKITANINGTEQLIYTGKMNVVSSRWKFTENNRDFELEFMPNNQIKMTPYEDNEYDKVDELIFDWEKEPDGDNTLYYCFMEVEGKKVMVGTLKYHYDPGTGEETLSGNLDEKEFNFTRPK